MTETITYRIGSDVAKRVFQAHGVRSEPGEPVASARRLRRAQVGAFLARLPPSLIGLETCNAAYHLVSETF